jgi:hypothetical protein
LSVSYDVDDDICRRLSLERSLTLLRTRHFDNETQSNFV